MGARLVKGEHTWMIALRPGPLPIKDMDKWQGSSSAFRGGSGVSKAARLTSLIPAKTNAEMIKTVQMPLRPLANAPGSSPIDSLLCGLAWWSIWSVAYANHCCHHYCHHQVGTCVSSRVITRVIVKLEDAQRERAQDTETCFLSRRISTEHIQPQWETWECMTHHRQRRDQWRGQRPSEIS